MDPDTCCDSIMNALDMGYYDEAEGYAGNLLNWLDGGGFNPALGSFEPIAEIASDSGEDFADYPNLTRLLTHTIPNFRDPR